MEQVIIFSIFTMFMLYIVRQHKKFLKNQSESFATIHRYIDSIDVKFLSKEDSISHIDIEMKAQ